MEWLKNNVMMMVVSFGSIAVMGMIIRALPDILEKRISDALDKLFLMGDPADDAWLVATIEWAEAKYGQGSGEIKANAVVTKIIGLLPIHYRLFVSDKMKAKAIEMFQKCFDRVEATFLKEVEQHK